MKLVILAAILGVAFSEHKWSDELTTDEVGSVNLFKLFGEWKNAFNKVYDSIEEEAYRFDLWAKAMKTIGEYNSARYTFKLRMNQFGDLTSDEFKLAVHGHTGSCLNVPNTPMKVDKRLAFDDAPVKAPSSVDWQAAGDVTPVKNQGQCGSCWAFASTGCIECNYAIQKGQLNSLSEQQLVDCTRSYGNYGCNGGWWYNAFDYVAQEGGLCTEAEYPYTARDGTCVDSKCGTKYDPIKDGVKVTPDSGTALETAVAQGCVAVGVEADQTSFQYYSSGVLTGSCGTSIDHGVLAVGYGTSGSQDYWKVKNSWGASWGDKGYIYICRNCNKNGNRGECGINMYPYLVAV